VSQEINLLNPALRPQLDWLSFRMVAPATLIVLALLVASTAFVRYRLATAQREERAASAQLAAARQEMQSLQSALAARKQSPALIAEAGRLQAAIGQRREVLRLANGLAAQKDSVAGVMRGFSQQRVDGVWLTAFSVGPSGFDLSGRLLDPALLPAYIRRLNAEPAFRGRHFAALDMRGVEPEAKGDTSRPAPATVAAAASTLASALAVEAPRRFTEFSLKATLPAGPAAGRRE